MMQDLLNRRSRKVIVSGRDDQLAKDGGDETPGHSLFMGTLLKGLESGEADLDHDNIVTASELCLYLVNKISQASSSEQTPEFGTFQRDEHGELVIFNRGEGVELHERDIANLGDAKVVVSDISDDYKAFDWEESGIAHDNLLIMAYRLVLTRKLPPEILVTLDANKINHALESLVPQADWTEQFHKTQEILADESDEALPNALWMEWMKATQGEKIDRLKGPNLE